MLLSRLQDAEACQDRESAQLVRKTAKLICKSRGLFEKDVGEPNDLGEVALLQAAAEGESALTLRLLKLSGANIETGLNERVASQKHEAGNEDCRREELESGDISAHGGDASDDEASTLGGAASSANRTALMIAAENGHANTVLVLYELGADVRRAGDDGLTALMLASRNGHTVTVRKLCELRADVHAVSKGAEPRTALMLAAEYGHVDTVQALFELGAHLWSTEVNDSALCLAARRGHPETVRLMCRLMSESRTQLIRNGLSNIVEVAGAGTRAISDRLASKDTLDELLLQRAGRPKKSNFGHIVEECLASNQKTVCALRELLHNVRHSHDLLVELEKARALALQHGESPQESPLGMAALTDDSPSVPSQPLAASLVSTRMGIRPTQHFNDGAGDWNGLAQESEGNVYREIREILEQAIQEVKDSQPLLVENPDGTSSNSRTQPPPEEGQNSVFHDLLGYGILAARFMLEYRGLISAAPTLPSVQVQPAIPNLPDSKG